jgi:hypothetical protein
LSGGLSAISLGGAVRAGCALVPDVGGASPADVASALGRAAAELGAAPSTLSGTRHVGLLLIDGISGAEEVVAAAIAAAAPQLPVVGGSAGDDAQWERTHVHLGGEAFSGAALLVLLELGVPFALVKTEHALPTEDRLVVTAVDYQQRRVLELNGRPARIELARRWRVSPDEVTRQRVNQTPFAVMLGGVPYLRTVADVIGDALRMAAAVDEGAVLRMTERGDLVQSSRAALQRARAQVRRPAGLIAFNCLGRFVEAESRGLTEELGRVYAEQPVAGFNTYGEQYYAMHVNHTLTGLYLGAGEP